ncbi:MAG: hypothetical protein ACQSGP_16505 [Frankia sp.]
MVVVTPDGSERQCHFGAGIGNTSPVAGAPDATYAQPVADSNIFGPYRDRHEQILSHLPEAPFYRTSGTTGRVVPDLGANGVSMKRSMLQIRECEYGYADVPGSDSCWCSR